jgi:hypothetical protein
VKAPTSPWAAGRFVAGAALLVAGPVPAPLWAADTLDQNRIARCQDLVLRQAEQATILPRSWHSWEDPVPRTVVPAEALGKIKGRDLLYNGGIAGYFELKAAPAGPFRKVFAYCSYDNLFVWLQGIDDNGVWTQFSATDYIAPY